MSGANNTTTNPYATRTVYVSRRGHLVDLETRAVIRRARGDELTASGPLLAQLEPAEMLALIGNA